MLLYARWKMCCIRPPFGGFGFYSRYAGRSSSTGSRESPLPNTELFVQNVVFRTHEYKNDLLGMVFYTTELFY